MLHAHIVVLHVHYMNSTHDTVFTSAQAWNNSNTMEQQQQHGTAATPGNHSGVRVGWPADVVLRAKLNRCRVAWVLSISDVVVAVCDFVFCEGWGCSSALSALGLVMGWDDGADR